MTAVLLSVHVLAAIVFIGPITAATSLFPRYARQALAQHPPPAEPVDAVLQGLHRVSTGYAVAAVAVPVFGVATAVQLGVLTDAWLLVASALTLVAAVLLAAVIVPGQRRVLASLRSASGSEDRPDGDRAPTPAAVAAGLPRLSMVTGLFALTWAVVVVLMIVRPGSTTGVGQ